MTQAYPQTRGDEAPTQSRTQRAVALLEVLLAFALVHVAWRSFKHFTWLGRLEASAHQNYSAGLTMILFTVLAVKLRGWTLSDFGMNLRDWRYNLNLGILWGILAPVSLLIVVWFSGFRPKDIVRPGTPWALALVGSGVALAYALILAWMLQRRRPAIAAVTPAAGISLLVVLLSLPILTAFHANRPVGPMVGVVGWMIVGAGLGEEVFFRGYVQTRLDLAFGQPIAVAGLRLGAGLIVSSILFGLVHALNTVDYFSGQFHFNWPSGLFSCFVGVVHAVMREKTGSIFPGVVAHALSDVLGRIPG